MFMRLLSIIGGGFFSCALLSASSITPAPWGANVYINNASGYACWEGCASAPYAPAPEAAASFSIPGFSMSFSGAPSDILAEQAGQPFPDPTFQLGFTGFFDYTFADNNFAGPLTLDGVTHYVQFTSNPYVEILGSAVTPSGVATLVFPALLTGDVLACENPTAFPDGGIYCESNAGFTAEIAFNLPGTVTFQFSPAPPGRYYLPNTEQFTAFFTPTPEPSSSWLVLGAMAAAGLLSRRVRRLLIM